MKYLKTSDELHESLFFNKYSKLQNKLTKQLGIDLYYLKSFGTTITATFPLFINLVNNGNMVIRDKDVILLVMGALSILFKENKSNIDKIVSLINEMGLSEVLTKFIETINNINKLFIIIAEKSDKVIENLFDMFSLETLLIPFLKGINKIVDMYKIDLESFNSDFVMNYPNGLQITKNNLIDMILKQIEESIKPKTTSIFDNEVVQRKLF
jgi:uncharacterized protein YjgD (DUF1641 family)